MARPRNTETTTETTIDDVAAAEEALAKLKKSVKYNFQKQAQRLHSLYKLLPAKFKRNVSFTDSPQWEDAEHVHFFHSINSNGEPQKECVPIGGHFHEMLMLSPATETSPPVYKCSGPLKRIRQKNYEGLWEVVNAPASSNDFHTHDIEYKHSEIWSPPNINPEFIKLQSEIAAKIVRNDSFVEQ